MVLERRGRIYSGADETACLEWFASSKVDRQSVQIHISDPMYSSTASSKTAVSSAADFEKQQDADAVAPEVAAAPRLLASASTSASTTPNGSASGFEKITEKPAMPDDLAAGAQGGARLCMKGVVEEFVKASANGSRIAVLGEYCSRPLIHVVGPDEI
jgi:hypothetical protein